MFQNVTTMLVADDSHLILLLENNGMRLDLYECNMNDHQLAAAWDTGDRQELRDAIIMIVLFAMRDKAVNEVYNAFTAKGPNNYLSAEQKDILYELAEPRAVGARIRLVIFDGSNMLPTIFNQPVDIEKLGIELCLPHRGGSSVQCPS